jgi:acetyl-CoA carboxylase biotin carboxylase subunit
MKLFNKILIANRGEIAVRIIKSAKKLGINTVAVYSEVDSGSLHVKLADEAFCLGEEELSDTYLNVEKIMAAAAATGCDALHPGYGFLAESPLLVSACKEAEITFIGPHLEAISLMGNKIEARKLVKQLNVPMTQGITGSPDELLKNASTIPFPLLVKAAAGGGGKGMRIARQGDNLKEILESTAREAKNYFGDGTIYIEQYIEEPRHIEFQVLGDNFGNIIHLFERECSIQRRYQKIIEESPSPTLTPEIRNAMGQAAVNIARAVKYNSAGTIEFLVDKNLNFYFLEMNTRIQVEHPVTEMVTGVDLVEEQILVAAGNPLRINQNQGSQSGHAIECRIYAEDPANDFIPSPGKMTIYEQPQGEGIRVDTSIESAGEVQSIFDPMISKLVVWGPNRELALNKSLKALKNYHIQGIKTNIPYLSHVLRHPAFGQNLISTKFCDEHTTEILENIEADRKELGIPTAITALILYQTNQHRLQKPKNVWESIGYWRNLMKIQLLTDEQQKFVQLFDLGKNHYKVVVNDEPYDVYLDGLSLHKIDFRIFNRFYQATLSPGEKGIWHILIDGSEFNIKRLDMLVDDEDYSSGHDGNTEGSLFAPMPGKVIKINVKEGDEVKRGTILLVVEAMKMENNIVALEDSIVEKVNVTEGDKVDTDLQLVHLNPINQE